MFKYETTIGVDSESVYLSMFKRATTVDEWHKILYTVQLQKILTLVSNKKTWAALRRLFGLASARTQRNSAF